MKGTGVFKAKPQLRTMLNSKWGSQNKLAKMTRLTLRAVPGGHADPAVTFAISYDPSSSPIENLLSESDLQTTRFQLISDNKIPQIRDPLDKET